MDLAMRLRRPQPRTIKGDGVWIDRSREYTRQTWPPERGRLGPGCARAYRGAGRGVGGGRTAGPPPGGDQGQLLLALPLARSLAGGVAGTLGAGRTGRSVRPARGRSEEHASELQSLMRTPIAVFCW